MWKIDFGLKTHFGTQLFWKLGKNANSFLAHCNVFETSINSFAFVCWLHYSKQIRVLKRQKNILLCWLNREYLEWFENVRFAGSISIINGPLRYDKFLKIPHKNVWFTLCVFFVFFIQEKQKQAKKKKIIKIQQKTTHSKIIQNCLVF